MTKSAMKLAWRNLWRHTQRTLMMIAIVAFGSLVILVLWGFTDGFTASVTQTQTRYNQSDFQIRAAGYAEDPIPANGLTPSQIEEANALLEGVRISAVAPRLETNGLLRSSYGSDGILVRGIDPTDEQRVTKLHNAITQGRFLSGDGEIVLSTRVAESLDIRLGERVVVMAQGGEGTSSMAFRAVGFFSLDIDALDRIAPITLADARALTGWNGLSSVAVKVPPGTSIDRLVASLQETVSAGDAGSLEVADFFTLNPMARIMLQGGTLKLIPLVLMIAAMAGFGVANTTFYSVLERTREFGVMTAVGMTKKMLARVILVESLFVASIGFVIGGTLGYGCLMYLSRYGVDFSRFMQGFGSDLGLPNILYATTSGWYWVIAFSVVVATALAATWYPVRRTNQLEPVSAIREG